MSKHINSAVKPWSVSSSGLRIPTDLNSVKNRPKNVSCSEFHTYETGRTTNKET